MKKLLLGLLLCGGIVLFLLSYFQHSASTITGQQPTVTPSQEEVAVTNDSERSGVPVRLRIPSLNVTAEVEHVGMDKKGNMDVPKQDENVAWYQPGFEPGKKGNAVIAGHLDTVTGKPAVFYHLGKLKKGDKILVETDEGNELSFIVTQKAVYPAASFPLVEVFGANSKARLNLITCEGTYSRGGSGYSHRTVVYSELEE